MKKRYLLLLAIFLLFKTNVNAAPTIGGIKCNYTLNEALTGGEICKAQVIVENYNSSPSVKVYYENTSGKMVEYSSPTYDYKNYGKDSLQRMLRFFTSQNKSKFADFYKKDGKCPSIYSNYPYISESYDIEFSSLDPTDTSSFKKLNATSEYLKEPNSNTWKTRTDFYKENNVETKEDRVCKYTMYFDLHKVSSEVELRTIYNPQNNNKTYKISVNGNTTTTTTLNEQVDVNLGLSTSGLVRIKSDQMKKLFTDGDCVDKSKVYHYLDSTTSDLGIYYITTNKEEAEKNGVDGRHDNGDGSQDGDGGEGSGSDFSGSLPSQGFGNGGESCADILGTNLSKVIKLVISIVRIAGAIIAIVNGMLSLIPAIVSKDPDALKKAGHKCMLLAIILLIIGVFPTILRVIGKLFGYDISCIF